MKMDDEPIYYEPAFIHNGTLYRKVDEPPCIGDAVLNPCGEVGLLVESTDNEWLVENEYKTLLYLYGFNLYRPCAKL